MAGGKTALNCSVEYISFSAHVDYPQNSAFIEAVASPHLVLVHGDANEMGRLRGALDDKYEGRDKPLRIYTPRNCEVVEFYFRGEKMAKTLGSLAKAAPVEDENIQGILVSRDFQYNIIAPQDLGEYTRESLKLSTINARQSVPCTSFSLVKWHLEMMYGSVEPVKGEEGSYLVFDTVKVSQAKSDSGGDSLVLEWQGNGVNDMIADSVLAIVLQAESSPASVKGI
jgi:cleavage and polyadenylation specificity factor subunit 3